MPRHLLLCLIALVACPVLAAQATPGRLPDAATPLHYALDLRVDPQQPHFSGEARIRIHLDQPSRSIRLHSRDLDIERVNVIDARGRRHPARAHADEALIAAGMVDIQFRRRLAAQDIELHIAYQAPFGQRMDGLYRMQVADRWYAASQLAVLSARQVFPSFDEPRFKTPFAVTITVPSGQQAFANGAETAVVPLDDGWQRFEFSTTPPIPTYLAAFAAGPWQVRQGPVIAPGPGRDSAIDVRGLSVVGDGERLDEALAETPELIASMEDYFATPYVYGKLDLLAAPEFAFGAMENPGLIIYRAAALLRDATTPTRTRRSSFNLHAHELAHQWVGNLVTLAWWDDLWLNEAFATWMAHWVGERLRPTWQIELTRFEETRDAFAADSLPSARRIRQPIRHDADIEGAFDAITYTKGAAVLHMLETWLGVDTFRDGIRRFVERHRHGVASSADLVAAMTQVDDSGLFAPALDSFLNQPGIPLLRTQLRCDGEAAELLWTQQRYVRAGSADDPATPQQWTLPLCLRLGHGADSFVQCRMIQGASGQVALERGCPDWYFPNADARGYYRFTATAADRDALSNAWDRLSEVERLAYADAVAAGFESGDVDATTVLDTMQRLADARSPQLLMALVDSFQWIREHLADETTRPALDAFVNRLYGPRLRSLGYATRPGEADEDTLLRGRLVALLSLISFDTETRAALLEQGDRLLAGTPEGGLDYDAVDNDLLAFVLPVLVQMRGQPAIDAVLAEIERGPTPIRRSSLFFALGSTLDAEQSQRIRNSVLGEHMIITDTLTVLAANYQHAPLRPAAWRWFQEHLETLLPRTPAMIQGYLPEALATGRCSQSSADELRAFFEPRQSRIAGSAAGMQRAMESITQCQALRERQSTPALEQWLRDAAR